MGLSDIMDSIKGYKIGVIALVFALLALSQAGAISTVWKGITCVNCTLDNPTFVNYTFSPGTGSDNTKVNKSGDNVSNDFTLHAIDAIRLHAGLNEFELSTGLVYAYNGVGILGFSPAGNNINMFPPVDMYNSLNMHNTNITNCLNCVNLSYLNVSLNNKVNKSGDTMTGNLNLVGNLTLGNQLGTYGLFQNNSVGYGQYMSIFSFDNIYGGFTGFNQNVYFNNTNKVFYQNNKSKGSIIFLAGGANYTASGQNYTLEVYGVKGDGVNYDTTARFEPILTGSDKSIEFYHNTTVYGKKMVVSGVNTGLQLYSPDGNPKCIRVNNFNIIASSNGSC
jgi:hypothetical protein